MKLKRTAAFLAISLIWGSMWIAQQQLPDPSTQLRFIAIALAVSAISLGLIAACFRLPLPAKKEWLASAVLGVTMIAVPYLLTIWASSHLSSGISAAIAAATPLLAGFLCDTPWSARNATIAGLGGVLLVVGGIVTPSLNQLPWAVVLLAGVFATAGSLVFAKRRLAKSHPIYTAAIQLAVASAILGLLAFTRRAQSASSPPWTLVLSAAAGNAAASALYFWLLKQVRVDQLASTVWAQLLIAVGESLFLLRPSVEWRILGGSAIVMASLIALARSEHPDSSLLTVKVT
jgi:drug/metabolite transporter (DMT)-like permease